MIRIIHNLGGCGGTLLSRCLGVLPNVVLLSEVNPLSVNLFASFNPLFQDENWLRLLGDEEREKLSGLDPGNPANFRAIIGALHQRAESSGRFLVVRDYNYVDFVGIPFLDVPPRKLMIYDGLPRAVSTRAIAFVRNPIDQYLSLLKHAAVSTVLKPAQFCDAYAAFLSELRDTPIFKYEDFVSNPEHELRRICLSLELPFDSRFKDEFVNFDFVSGDFSRHSDPCISMPVKRQLPEGVIEEFRASRSLQEIATRLKFSMNELEERLSNERISAPNTMDVDTTTKRHRPLGPERELYDSDDLGQATDYRLARAALEACGESPVVIDVGAERGSFTALALSAGASVVHAYEPLPRHVESLRRRFKGEVKVIIHDCAVSTSGGQANLHIAIDPSGHELDYHHTLSAEVGDSIEVIRSARTLGVETVALADEIAMGRVPPSIGFLKIDTEGHDLDVLHGLGEHRPYVIMAEFWEDLPATSGKNPYRLDDLVAWSRAHAYSRHIVIRRRGPIETVAIDEKWSIPGNWGNVLFFTAEVWARFWSRHADAIGQTAFEALHAGMVGLANDCEAKEAEIRGLADALDRTRAESSQTRDESMSALKAQEERSTLTGPWERIAELERVAEERRCLLEKIHAEAQRSVADFKTRIQMEEDRIKELEQVVEERRCVLERVHAESEERLAAMQARDRELQACNERITILESAIAAAKPSINELTTIMTTQEARIAALEKVAEERRAALERVHAEAERGRDELMRVIKMHEERNAELERLLNEARSDLVKTNEMLRRHSVTVEPSSE